MAARLPSALNPTVDTVSVCLTKKKGARHVVSITLVRHRRARTKKVLFYPWSIAVLDRGCILVGGSKYIQTSRCAMLISPYCGDCSQPAPKNSTAPPQAASNDGKDDEKYKGQRPLVFLPSQLARAAHRAVVLDSPHETLVVTAAANKLRMHSREHPT